MVFRDQAIFPWTATEHQYMPALSPEALEPAFNDGRRPFVFNRARGRICNGAIAIITSHSL